MTITKDEYRKGLRNGSEWIKLEDFKPLRIYAITYCPEDQPSDTQVRSLTTFHAQKLRAIKSDTKDYIFFMLPEFGANNRLHYHGIVAFMNGLTYIQFKEKFKADHIVLKRIRTYSDHQKWYAYFVKQWQHLASTFFLPFGDFKMFEDYFYSYVFRGEKDIEPLPPFNDEGEGLRYVSSLQP